MKGLSGGKHGKKSKDKSDSRKGRKEKSKKDAAKPHFMPMFQSGDWDLKDFLESQECNLKPKESISRSSRLSPSLKETLASPLALAYFMEYLEAKDMKHLVDFWLAVQAFEVVALERSRLNSDESVCKNLVGTTVENDCTNLDLLGDLDYCFECRNLRERGDSSNFRLKSRGLQCGHRSKENHSAISVNSFAENHLNGHACSNSELNNSQKHQHSHTFSEVPGQKDLVSVGLNFAQNWEPFSSQTDTDCPTKAEGKEDKRRDSYVARRIMSKQTRIRTKSAVVDAVGLYARYISLDADQPLGLPSRIRNHIEAEICRHQDNVNPHCFKDAQDFILAELDPIHKQFLECSHGNKYKLYLLRETKARLQDVLYNETSLFYFMEHLDRENCREILEFWLMAENFEQNIQMKLSKRIYDSAEALEDAMSLYDKYFSMRAKHQIIKDDKLRIVIENNICREDGPQPNCFCIPVAYAWTALKEIFFERFLVSDSFMQLLESICKGSVEHPANDEVSSTISSDSRSESTEFLPKSLSEPDFLDQDADDLWHRPDAGRLAMGYVNPLGVFVTEIDSAEGETTNETSSVSKLGKAMKNLLSRESKEEQERIAWEKAKKFVEDVQRQANRNKRTGGSSFSE